MNVNVRVTIVERSRKEGGGAGEREKAERQVAREKGRTGGRGREILRCKARYVTR